MNRVACGKTHHNKSGGMPCFAVNTKLETAMIDSSGGGVRVNNFLSALNLKTIDPRNLKEMERRAGEVIQSLAIKSTNKSATEAYKMEMNDIAQQESQKSQQLLEDAGVMNALGVWLPPDASPSVRKQFEIVRDEDSEWTDIEDELQDIPDQDSSAVVSGVSVGAASNRSYKTPVSNFGQVHRNKFANKSVNVGRPVKLANKFPCRTRKGMSCAVDTAWHKRGFDSLTSHTFFMSKSQYGKEVLKTVVRHRKCGTCNWWRQNKPGEKIRNHQCVRNHTGSERAMESVSGVQGIKEFADDGIPVEYLDGDGDNTMIARLKTDLNIDMKKRFDRNHVVKNVGKHLYALHNNNVLNVKLSKIVIAHIEKCLKYAFAKNQGDKTGMEKNLKALIPHQFGDHSMCTGYFCGYKRKQGEVYQHRSLPYKTALRDPELRSKLQKIFDPLIANVEQNIDLESSQQCEHANREVHVTLRAPKTHYYGNTKSLDYRVHATVTCINEGRYYIAQDICNSVSVLLLCNVLYSCSIFRRDTLLTVLLSCHQGSIP